MGNPNIYISLIYLDKKVVGGVRMQIKDNIYMLPIEVAIDYLDKQITCEVAQRMEGITGEACGLWIGDEVRNMKMGLVLTRNTVVIAKKLKLKSLFALTSQYTLNMTGLLGFMPLNNLGENGSFVYPTEEYKSTVCVNDDIDALSTADEHQKSAIEHLFQHIISDRIEQTEKGPVEIEYNFSAIQS
jgi:hypothetical protein